MGSTADYSSTLHHDVVHNTEAALFLLRQPCFLAACTRDGGGLQNKHAGSWCFRRGCQQCNQSSTVVVSGLLQVGLAALQEQVR
jgi:hypothetical protein